MGCDVFFCWTKKKEMGEWGTGGPYVKKEKVKLWVNYIFADNYI